MGVPLIDVQAHRALIGEEIDQGIARVVAHGKWIMGPEVAQLEGALVDWIGDETVQAISCANGTDALVLAAQALGLQPGQAVVCPSFTFIATAEAVAALGGVPVFADVGYDDFNLDPASTIEAIARATDQGLDVVGIIAVDLFGQPADYVSLRAIARDSGCWLIADAAQSFGASRDGERVGSMADVTTTSFFPAKPLGCYGDGGAVFTARADLAETLRSLRVHGKGSDKYDNVLIGQNSRLDTIQAAILLPKLAILAKELEDRQRVAERYAEALGAACVTPQLASGVQSAWAQYTIRCEGRDGLRQVLSDAGIGNAVYYPTPLHQQTAYRRFHVNGVDLPVSESLSTTVLSLPMFPYLSASDQSVAIGECMPYLTTGQRHSA